ncbi:MAG: response regulator transcription factor [Dehalococcoidales bacterium]|nr:response regulator transcription factor [Dehalococcoidales bacterium]
MVSAKKILIVSADILLFQRLRKQLSEEEYTICLVARTDETLKNTIDELVPDIIVVDPDISILHGVEISLLIRQWTPKPILILTTAMTLDNQVRALDLAAENYLSEPFEMSIVAGRIEHVLSLEQAAESVND